MTQSRRNLFVIGIKRMEAVAAEQVYQTLPVEISFYRFFCKSLTFLQVVMYVALMSLLAFEAWGGISGRLFKEAGCLLSKKVFYITRLLFSYVNN